MIILGFSTKKKVCDESGPEASEEVSSPHVNGICQARATASTKALRNARLFKSSEKMLIGTFFQRRR